MAVQVWQPQKQDKTAGTLGTVGGIVSMFPHPAAKAAGMGMQFLAAQPQPGEGQKPMSPAPAQSEVPQSLQMPDRSGAIARRSELQADDPLARVEEARQALAALDIDPELRARLQKPLDMAIQAQRSI